MNSNNSQKAPVGGIIILLTAAAIAGFGVIQALKPQTSGRNEKLPYQYDIEKLKEVPKELIKWEQVNTIDPGGKATTIAVDGEDRLYIAVEDVILVGNERRQIRLPGPATALAVATDGTIYAGLAGHIAAIKPDGSVSEWQEMGEKALITSIAVGGKDVFVADSGNRTIWRYDLSGALVGSCRGPDKGGFSVPSAYFDVMLSGDHLLIVDPGRQDVGTYDFEFNRKSGWGQAGESIGKFAGCCNPSHIAQLPDGAIVTAEKGLPRIKVCEPDGTLREVVAPPTLLTGGVKPCSIATDSHGRIYALDLNTGKIRVFERLKEATP